MPITTTADAVRAAIVTTIRGITPTYQPGSDSRWHPVEDVEHVPSPNARNFFVDLGTPVGTGVIYGGCELNEAELLIYTSYGGMKPAEQQNMSSRDHQDLWRELHRAEIDGARKFDKGGFDREGEDGRLWGAHVFTAHLFLPLP